MAAFPVDSRRQVGMATRQPCRGGAQLGFPTCPVGILEELIELAGLPADALETIAHYNEMCDAGDDLDFHKDAQYMIPVRQAPFYCQIVNHHPVRFYTILGGLRTNANMQVLDENDEIIPGLYNVGTGVGDMFAGKYTFMMTGGNYGIIVRRCSRGEEPFDGSQLATLDLMR